MKNAEASSVAFAIRSPRAQAWQLPRRPLAIAPLLVVESGKGLARFARRRRQKAEAISARGLRRTVGGARR